MKKTVKKALGAGCWALGVWCSAFGTVVGTVEKSGSFDTRAEREVQPAAVQTFQVSANAWGEGGAQTEATVTYARDGGEVTALGSTAGSTLAWTPKEAGTYVFTHSPGTGISATFAVAKTEGQKAIEAAFGGDAKVEPRFDDAGNVTNWVVTVTNGVTVAAPDALADLPDGVVLTLPDGWQGELPKDEQGQVAKSGTWYGAKVELTAIPLAVRTVTTATHWPWDGKIDIACNLTGEGTVQLAAALTTNGVKVCDATVLTGTTMVDLDAVGWVTNGVKFVWNAKADIADTAFLSDAATVVVTATKMASSASTASGASAAFRFDRRETVAVDSAVTIADVSHSDTAWGAAAQASVALGWTNETTGATGVFAGADELDGEGELNVSLPKKNGDYRLTHSTGDLTSFAKFVVSDYPFGCATNPWLIGADDDPTSVTAVSNGVDSVYFKPVRGTVTKAGMETIASAMGGASFFMAKLVSEDGSTTNALKMLLGGSGTPYYSIAAALEGDESRYTLYEVEGYWVSYDGNGAAGSMATDMFIPSVPTNLTAVGYSAVGWEFLGWMTNGCEDVAYLDRASGVDFIDAGQTLELTAKWNAVETIPTGFDDLTNMIALASLPLTFTLNDEITVPDEGVIEIPDGKSVTFIGDGTISGQVLVEGEFIVGGTVKIDCVMLPDGKTIGVSAENPLAEGASIEVLTENSPTRGNPVAIVGAGASEDSAQYFHSKEFGDASEAVDGAKAFFENDEIVLRRRGEREAYPWNVGQAGEEQTATAWEEGGTFYTKPLRGTASVESLEAVTNLNGGVMAPFEVITPDGSETNDVVMFLGDNGVPYDTLADVLAADPRPTTVRLFEVKGADVEFNAMGGVHTNGLEIVTNFCIVTYTLPEAPTRADYEFLGWYDGWANGAAVVTNGQDLLSYEPHSLYAKWQSTKLPPSPTPGEPIIKTDGNGTIQRPTNSVPDELILPETDTGAPDGTPLTKIDAKAFAALADITKVALPLYVNEIGARAFYNDSNLGEVIFVQPRDFNTLEKVQLKIGEYAFMGSKIESVTIPSKTSEIGAAAFANCANLTNVTILGALTINGQYPFRDCGTTKGGVTITLSPRAASNQEFINSLTNGCNNAVINPKYAGEINITGDPRLVDDTVELDFAYTADDVDINVDTVTAVTAASLDEIGVTAKEPMIPLEVRTGISDDGSVLYTAVFEKPEGSSGFFRITVNIEK